MAFQPKAIGSSSIPPPGTTTANPHGGKSNGTSPLTPKTPSSSTSIPKNPDKARDLKALLDQIIRSGRSIPGPVLQNDSARRGSVLSPSNAPPAGPWKSGDFLNAADSPKIAGNSFILTARIIPEKNAGAIIAQGGARNGYSLYLQEGQLTFAIRNDGTLTTASAPAPALFEPAEIEATLEKSGKLILKINGTQAATAEAETVITQQPADPLSIGRDVMSPVAPDAAPYEFQGTIESARLLFQ